MPTPTPTPTPASTPTGSDVQIIDIFWDGLVPSTEADEYVAIKNLGDTAQSLQDWYLMDIADGGPVFTFPSYVLNPGVEIRVYTNEIHPEWGGFSFGSGSAIWSNGEPDTAGLFNDEGVLVSSMSY